MNVKDSPQYKRALKWLNGCKTQTPSVEEVMELIEEVSKEKYEEGREVGYNSGYQYGYDLARNFYDENYDPWDV